MGNGFSDTPKEHFFAYWYVVFYFSSLTSLAVIHFTSAGKMKEQGKLTAEVFKRESQLYRRTSSLKIEGIKEFVPNTKTKEGEKTLELEDSIYCLTFVSTMKDICGRYDLTHHLDDYVWKTCMIFSIQILIIVFIIRGAIKGQDELEYIKPNIENMTLRLLACYLFHLQNYSDVADAFRRLKFLKNNGDRFIERYIFSAFLCTQFQFWAAFLAELANLVFMCRQKALTDIIMNYLAFAGIAEIDNIFARAQRYLKVKDELIDKVDQYEQDLVEQFLTFKKESKKR